MNCKSTHVWRPALNHLSFLNKLNKDNLPWNWLAPFVFGHIDSFMQLSQLDLSSSYLDFWIFNLLIMDMNDDINVT